MKWFKHDTDSTQDAKVKKLLIRYGAVGYAIYFHCLELIAMDLNESNITFELEHDSEIIADNLKVKGTANQSGVEIVEETMRFMVELGLFIERDLKIFCLSMFKRLDSSMTSNKGMRRLIASAKQSHDPVMIESCKKEQKERKKEQIDKMTTKQQDSLKELFSHNIHTNITFPQTAKYFKQVCIDYPEVTSALQLQYQEYLESCKDREPGYIKTIPNWLKDECFNTSWKPTDKPKSPVYYQDIMYEFRNENTTEDRKHEIISELRRKELDTLKSMGYDIDKYRSK